MVAKSQEWYGKELLLRRAAQLNLGTEIRNAKLRISAENPGKLKMGNGLPRLFRSFNNRSSEMVEEPSQ